MKSDGAQPPSATVRDYPTMMLKRRLPGEREPKNYKLSQWRIDYVPPTRQAFPVQFWSRTRYVSAFASHLSYHNPNLLHLQLAPSRVAHFVSLCCGFLPSFIQSWAKRFLPEWFLPNRLVLKTHRKPDQDVDEWGAEEFFHTEVQAYQRLEPLQGTVVPQRYDVVDYYDQRALLIEHLGCVSLRKSEGATMTIEQLSDLLQPCFRALHAFGVELGFPQPEDLQLVGGKIMVIDLEQVTFDLEEDDELRSMEMSIAGVAETYRGIQAFLRSEG